MSTLSHMDVSTKLLEELSVTPIEHNYDEEIMNAIIEHGKYDSFRDGVEEQIDPEHQEYHIIMVALDMCNPTVRRDVYRMILDMPIKGSIDAIKEWGFLDGSTLKESVKKNFATRAKLIKDYLE